MNTKEGEGEVLMESSRVESKRMHVRAGTNRESALVVALCAYNF